jgi:drug/metabolite transporter (DMT)-like permease
MNRLNWTRLGILSLLWGGSFFFVEVSLTGLPPLLIVWLRVALAAICLALTLRVMRQAFPKGRTVWAALLVQGFLNNVIPFTLFALAQGQITGGLASIVNATTPLWTVAVAHFLTMDEGMTPAKALGLAFGISGVVVLSGGRIGGDIWAIMACLGAALSYAFASIWARRFRSLGLSPLQTAFGQVTGASMILLVPMLALSQPWALALPAPSVLAAVLGLAVLSTALAYLLFFQVLSSAGPINVSLVTFLIPPSALMLGIAFLGETVAPHHLAGLGLIFLGLLAMDGRMGNGRMGKRGTRHAGT